MKATQTAKGWHQRRMTAENKLASPARTIRRDELEAAIQRFRDRGGRVERLPDQPQAGRYGAGVSHVVYEDLSELV